MSDEPASPDQPRPPGREDQTQNSVELLERFHDFPCTYMFKIIGYGAEGFVESVRAAAEPVLGRLRPGRELRSRPSRSGRYLAVTLEKEVAGAHQVLAVYQALRGLEGVVALI